MSIPDPIEQAVIDDAIAVKFALTVLASESAALNRDSPAGTCNTDAPQTPSSSESEPEAESLGSTGAALTGYQRRMTMKEIES